MGDIQLMHFLCMLMSLFLGVHCKTDILLGILNTWEGGVWKKPDHLLGVLPAIDKINNDPNILPNHTLTFQWSDTQCKTPHADLAALSLLMAGAQTLIGSPCSGDSIEAAPMVGHFDATMVSYYSVSPTLSNKMKYPFFSRVLGTTVVYDLVAIGLLKALGMKHAAPIYPLSSGFSLPWAATMRVSLKEADITQDIEMAYMDFGQAEVNQLKEAGVRVVIWLDYNCGRMRDLLFNAHKYNILKGWMWILDGVTTVCWKKGDDKDSALLQAFDGQYSIYPYFKVSQDDYDILDASNPRLGPHVQPLYGAEGGTYTLDGWSKAGVGAALLHDAIFLYAHAAHALLSRGEAINDAKKMQAELVKTTFTGMTGVISLGENGDRLANAEMKLLTINEAGDGLKDERVGIYGQVLNQFDMVMAKTSLVFPGGVKTLPRDFSLKCEGGFYTKKDNATCIPCPAGLHAAGSEFDRFECKPCEAGSYAPQPGLSDCFPCSGLATSPAGAEKCTLCRPGYFTNPQTTGKADDELCLPCLKGQFSISVGESQCSECMAGRYSKTTGNTQCVQCVPGSYANATGGIACSRCKVGTFADTDGMSLCTKCSGMFTTQFLASQAEEDCVCPQGTYLGPDNTQCIECPEGMTCNVGSTQAGFTSPSADMRATAPTVDYGYYTTVEKPLFVYACEPLNVCPGGTPGTCAGRRVGLLCMKCPEGYIVTGIAEETPSAADYAVENVACVECTSGREIYIVVMLVLGILMIGYELREAKHSPLDDSPLLVEIKTVVGQVVMFMQILGAIQSADVVFSTTFADFVSNLTQPLELDFVFEGLPCMSSGFDDAIRIFAMQLLGPVFFMFFISFSFMIVNCIRPKYLMFDGLLNCFGEVLIEFYVSITIAVLGPFNCYDHPVEKASMAFRPEVICYEGDHSTLIALSVCGFLLYTVGALAVTVFATIQHPKRMAKNDIGMLVRCHFLFNRYKPTAYWFCVISVFRNCGVAFWPMVLSNKDVALGLMMVTLMVPLILSCTCTPRRTGAMNSLDGLVSFVQVMILSIGSMTVYSDKALVDTLQSGALGIFLCFLCVLIAVIAGFFVMTKGLQWISGGKQMMFWAFDMYIDHHGGQGAVSARTMTLMFTDLCRKGKVFFDVDWWHRTRSLGTIMDAAKLSDQFVVALSNETWCIAYCTGAICSAVQKKVPLTSVTFGLTYKDPGAMISTPSQTWETKDTSAFQTVLDMLAKQAPRTQLRPLGLPDGEIPKAMQALYGSTNKAVVFAMDAKQSAEDFMLEVFAKMPSCPLAPGMSMDAGSRSPVISRFFSKADAAQGGNTAEEWYFASKQVAMISCDHNDLAAVAVSRLFYRIIQDILKDSGTKHSSFIAKLGKIEALAKGDLSNDAANDAGYNPGVQSLQMAGTLSMTTQVLSADSASILHALGVVEDIDLNANQFAKLAGSERLLATIVVFTDGSYTSAKQLLRLGYTFQQNPNGLVSYPISISNLFAFPGTDMLKEIENGAQPGLARASTRAASIEMTTGNISLKRISEALQSVFQARTYLCNVPALPPADIRVCMTNVMSKVALQIALGPPGNQCQFGEEPAEEPLEDVAGAGQDPTEAEFFC